MVDLHNDPDPQNESMPEPLKRVSSQEMSSRIKNDVMVRELEKFSKNAKTSKTDKTDSSSTKIDNADRDADSTADKTSASQGESSISEESSADDSTATTTGKVPALTIEDTGTIIPKGTIKKPKLTQSHTTREERQARKAAREEKRRLKEMEDKSSSSAIGRWWHKVQASPDRIKFGMCIIAIGVVYGDIGTSPLYTIQTFVSGQGSLVDADRFSVLGMLSLIFWTLVMITSIKYVIVAMRIDNKGEGGIFALYSLVRKYAKWLIVPAMIGGAAFLADSVLTPAVSISSAVEGMNSFPQMSSLFNDFPQLPLVITIIIVVALFSVQFRGTEKIGRVFGSVMIVWFLFIALVGAYNLSNDWGVFRALDPVIGIQFLFSGENRAGLALMGTVFLCTTGAEALYSDMGHVGRGSIYATWPFIKLSLILCYFGQGAWILKNSHNPVYAHMPQINPFFTMVPTTPIRSFAVVLSIVAGIIASQALITGAYTIISEATGLNWMPHLQVRFPSRMREQMYIPTVNFVLCIATLTVLTIFQSSEHIAAAYGLALTMTMLATTILLSTYIWAADRKPWWAILFALIFSCVEVIFLLASLVKFFHGGWFTMMLTILLLIVMYSWWRGTQVERSERRHMTPREFLPALNALYHDDSIQRYADNVVYLTSDSDVRRLDTAIFYSIFGNRIKRARAWWAISVDVAMEPFTREYSVENFGTDYLFRVRLRLGFKVNQNIAIYLHQIMHDLIDAGEFPSQPTIYPKVDDDQQIGSIQYIMIRKRLMPESRVHGSGALALRIKYAIRAVAGSPEKWFGLSAYNPHMEIQPLFVSTAPTQMLKRVALRKVKQPVTLQTILAEVKNERENVEFKEQEIRRREEEWRNNPLSGQEKDIYDQGLPPESDEGDSSEAI